MKRETLEDYQTRMTRVLVHIRENLDKDPNLDELAGVACFSNCHFHCMFRGMLGESVREHIRRLRLERAAQQLRHTGRRVT